MTKWKVFLTPEFKKEFYDIYNYIANILLSPTSAKKQIEKILKYVENLCEMPKKFSLVEQESWRSRGLRKMVVDNYIVFYYLNKIKSEVVIFHVFYGGRNIDELL